MQVFAATATFGEDDAAVLKALRRARVDMTLNPHRRRLTEAEIGGILAEGKYVGLLAGLEPLTGEVLARATGLKVISRVGVGLDNVDQPAARKLGIKVFNTPGVLTDAVAELTLGLMLSAVRKIALLDRQLHGGRWEKSMGALLKGKVVGLVGFGNIGQRVAELAQAFGCEVVFYDVRKVKRAGARPVTWAKLIKTADVISLHSSGKGPLIGAQEIQAMKPGVVLVNTARGSLIEEKSLLEGLASGRIACAALDVFPEEPYQGELVKQDNVILTPHVGSYAKEARVVMERMAVENLLRGLKGK